MPERLQLSRRKGARLPEGAAVVSRPSKWGNPFRIGDPCTDPLFVNAYADGVPLARSGVVEDRAHAVELFAFWVMAKVPFTAADVESELAGRDLACWCPLPEPGEPDHCHARILLEIANPEEAPRGR